MSASHVIIAKPLNASTIQEWQNHICLQIQRLATGEHEAVFYKFGVYSHVKITEDVFAKLSRDGHFYRFGQTIINVRYLDSFLATFQDGVCKIEYRLINHEAKIFQRTHVPEVKVMIDNRGRKVAIPSNPVVTNHAVDIPFAFDGVAFDHDINVIKRFELYVKFVTDRDGKSVFRIDIDNYTVVDVARDTDFPVAEGKVVYIA